MNGYGPLLKKKIETQTYAFSGNAMTEFLGVVTVSDKGQIAIPIDVRREPDI